MLDLVSEETGKHQKRSPNRSRWVLLSIIAFCFLFTACLCPIPAYATDYFPTSVSVASGTITSGTVSDVLSVNGVYFTVRESGAFQITYTFTNNIPAIQNSINFTGRYQGNTTHNVELQIWNYSTSAWDNVRAATKYFPLSTTDYNISFAIPGTLANYYTGTAPNLTARIRVNHTSGAITTHYFYTDMISLSTMADLSLTKTVSSTPPIVGNTSIYTITVSNAGPNGATGVVETDVLPAGVTYVSNDLGAANNSGTGR